MDVWQSSEYASELASKVKYVESIWISKVTGNLLLGKSKRKSQKNFKIVERKVVKQN